MKEKIFSLVIIMYLVMEEIKFDKIIIIYVDVNQMKLGIPQNLIGLRLLKQYIVIENWVLRTRNNLSIPI